MVYYWCPSTTSIIPTSSKTCVTVAPPDCGVDMLLLMLAVVAYVCVHSNTNSCKNPIIPNVRTRSCLLKRKTREQTQPLSRSTHRMLSKLLPVQHGVPLPNRHARLLTCSGGHPRPADGGRRKRVPCRYRRGNGYGRGSGGRVGRRRRGQGSHVFRMESGSCSLPIPILEVKVQRIFIQIKIISYPMYHKKKCF